MRTLTTAALVVSILLPVAAAASPANHWYPAGYHVAPKKPDIAGKWDPHPRCAYGASCVGFYAVARNGCPNGLYGEINIIVRGVVVRYTNDALGSLRPRQIGHLTFNVYDLPAHATYELSKLKCY